MHTFKSLLSEQAILIPMIQRDYAQGRRDVHATRVRQEIVEQLKQATLYQKGLDFDFIYGAVREGALRPLDGQQRLTTLFLLYWYIGKYRKSNLPSYLYHFTYETRISARDFFNALRDKEIVEISNQPLSSVIHKQKWFQEAWLNDPTIQGALTMLDTINETFKDVPASEFPDLEFEEPNVTFHYLDLDTFQLDESLYIKMNSRGKPLTAFEHFKAQFEQMLEKNGWIEEQQEFAQKVEVKWSDLLWPYRDLKTQTIDSAFLNLFRFISSILVLQESDSEFDDQEDLFASVTIPERFKVIYQDCESVRFLFDALDAWSSADVMVQDFKKYVESIPLINQDLLTRLLTGKLSNEDQFIVYAILLLRQNELNENIELVRVLRNVIEGIRQNNQGVYNSNLRFEMFGSLYKQIKQFITKDGTIIERLERLETPFNARVIEHEIEKQVWLTEYPQFKSLMYQLENHPILKGLTHRVFPAFMRHGEVAAELIFELLEASPAQVSRAMLAIEDFDLVIGRSNLGPRYVFGGTKYKGFVWTNQLGTDEQEEEKQLQLVLDRLIDYLLEIEGEVSARLKQVIDDWSGDRDWRYYLIRYDNMLTDKGHVFTLQGKNAWQMERLNGVSLQGSHANPIYFEVAEHSPEVTVEEVYYNDYSEMTVNGTTLFIVDGVWEVEGDYDKEALQRLVDSNEDLVEQGIKLAHWFSQKSQIVTP